MIKYMNHKKIKTNENIGIIITEDKIYIQKEKIKQHTSKKSVVQRKSLKWNILKINRTKQNQRITYENIWDMLKSMFQEISSTKCLH